MSKLIQIAVALAMAWASLVSAAEIPGKGQAVCGRFIRVESAASEDYLHFAEIEVYVAGKNVAVGKPVKASSTMGRFTPEKSVDGIVQYTWGDDASLWSSAGRGDQWWELDLGEELPIEKVVLYNRLDCCQERLAGAVLTVLGANRQTFGRMAIDDTAVNPLALVFFDRPLPPVDLASQTVAERLAALAPRFTAPSKDTAYVMPVGSGDLSAMLRYDEAWEIHLSKTDFFVPGNIASPPITSAMPAITSTSTTARLRTTSGKPQRKARSGFAYGKGRRRLSPGRLHLPRRFLPSTPPRSRRRWLTGRWRALLRTTMPAAWLRAPSWCNRCSTTWRSRAMMRS